MGGSGDSHLNYAIAGAACVPHVRSVEAVSHVPWKPHCGLSIRLQGSGQQLMMRKLPTNVFIFFRPTRGAGRELWGRRCPTGPQAG
eukprot:1378332-Pyramimonas_sp.AAC.1